MNNYLDLINNSLKNYLNSKNINDELLNAMEYSLLSSGKRIRPLLLLKFCEACNGDINKALPFACAIEMIHTYSLIHDDLPCMDDDDFRRGKPSCHIKFGEAMALLAGDALLNLAYEILFSSDTRKLLSSDLIIKAADVLSFCSGKDGMIGGQVIDLKSTDKFVSVDVLNEMYLKKTAMLIMTAAQIGCIVANADDKKINAAKNYAKFIGIAFQIKDDILDVTSNKEITGKSSSDVFNKKSTYVSLFGLEKATAKVKELTFNAINELNIFDSDVEWLKNFAVSLEKRSK